VESDRPGERQLPAGVAARERLDGQPAGQRAGQWRESRHREFPSHRRVDQLGGS
jgi:hypothetical protein